MVETSVIKRLLNVDRELHLLIEELQSKTEPKISLEDLRKLLDSEVKTDIDPTKLVRQMRDKEYNL